MFVSPILRLTRVFESNKKNFYNLQDFSLTKPIAFVHYPVELGQIAFGWENLEHSCTGAEMKKDDYILMTVVHNI